MAYLIMCKHATNQMFEHKPFHLKFPTVLFDTVMQWASYICLFLSALEIKDTDETFPFGAGEEKVNKRIKDATLVLFLIYFGMTGLGMVLSLFFIYIEDQYSFR